MKTVFSRKDLFKLLLPLMFEQLLAVTIGMADIAMVTPIGEAATSGVSLVDAINMLLAQVFVALATGGAIVAAQYLGRDDRPAACEAARQLVAVTAVGSAAVAAICVVARTFLLGALYGGIEPAVMQSAQDYFLMTALSYPFIALYNAGAALFRAQGNSRVSLAAALLMNVVNIGANAVFIFGLGLGAMGAGLGTLISRAVGAGAVLWLLRNPHNRVFVSDYGDFAPNRGMVKTILRIAVPNGLENGVFHIGKLLVAGLVASFGTAAIAANAVGHSISSGACVPANAVGLGMIAVVGQCVGAGQYDMARRYTRRLLGLAYLVGGVVNLAVLVFARQISGLFPLGEEAVSLAAMVVAIHAGFAIFFMPGAFVLPCALRAAGDVRFAMTASVATMWIFRIGLSYVLGRGMGLGLVGVWLAMGIDWIVRTALFAWRLESGGWRKARVI
jgi:putative MATE family efflux protein